MRQFKAGDIIRLKPECWTEGHDYYYWAQNFRVQPEQKWRIVGVTQSLVSARSIGLARVSRFLRDRDGEAANTFGLGMIQLASPGLFDVEEV
jgi:hypothetical protein